MPFLLSLYAFSNPTVKRVGSSATICTCFSAFSVRVGIFAPPTCPPPRTGSTGAGTGGCGNKLTFSGPPPCMACMGAGTGGCGNRLTFSGPPPIPPPCMACMGAGVGGCGNRLTVGSPIPLLLE